MIRLLYANDDGVTLENIGKKIHYLRMRKGWSRRILADNALISEHAIIAVEVGNSYPRLDTLVMIIDALGYEIVLREK